jgi:hypothetical protein
VVARDSFQKHGHRQPELLTGEIIDRHFHSRLGVGISFDRGVHNLLKADDIRRIASDRE